MLVLSSTKVSSKCQRGIGKLIGQRFTGALEWIQFLEWSDLERDFWCSARITRDEDSSDGPINGIHGLRALKLHVGANWSQVWKEFLWANLGILFTACKHYRLERSAAVSKNIRDCLKIICKRCKKFCLFVVKLCSCYKKISAGNKFAEELTTKSGAGGSLRFLWLWLL